MNQVWGILSLYRKNYFSFWKRNETHKPLKIDFSLLKIELPLQLKPVLTFHFLECWNFFFWNFLAIRTWWMCDNSQINAQEPLVMLYSLLDLFMKMMDLGNPSDLMDDLKLNGMMMMTDLFLLWHLHIKCDRWPSWVNFQKTSLISRLTKQWPNFTV